MVLISVIILSSYKCKGTGEGLNQGLWRIIPLVLQGGGVSTRGVVFQIFLLRFRFRGVAGGPA